MELNTLKDEMLALRKNTGEATDQKNTWATKYEALEHNFKQVGKRSSGPRTHREVIYWSIHISVTVRFYDISGL